MTYLQYAACTWREFILRTRAYNRVRSKEFEHTRAIVYTVASANRDSKKAWPLIEQFWPLPTDDDNVKKEKKSITTQREALITRLNEVYGSTLLKKHGKLLA